MYNYIRTFRKAAAVAVVGALAALGTVQIANAQAAEKKVKDQGEYDLYNQFLKDQKGNDAAAQIKDLNQWTEKYPDSDYKELRQFYYIQAYNAANQPDKVLDITKQLMDRDLKSVFMKDDPKTGPAQVLSVLYLATLNFAKMPNPSADQAALGERITKALLDYVPEYFVAANKQPNVSDADWAKTKGQVEDLAKGVLLARATKPADEAMAKYRADTTKNPEPCKVAEQGYLNALKTYPDNPAIAYRLGTAEICLYKVAPEKINLALWMMARAVAIDPTLGGTADKAQIERYLNSTWTQFHGGDDAGLQALKDQAKQSLMPPDGFKIKSQIEIAHEKEEEFKKSNPQLALWMGIKGQLAEGGEQYFESNLKAADVPPLKGTVVDAKPACRSKELLVAVSDPTHAEVTLKLDAALTGKPETGTEIQFKGVPSSFVKDPFMLTMDAEKANLEGLKVTPCAGAAAPVRKTVPAAKKK